MDQADTPPLLPVRPCVFSGSCKETSRQRLRTTGRASSRIRDTVCARDFSRLDFSSPPPPSLSIRRREWFFAGLEFFGGGPDSMAARHSSLSLSERKRVTP